MKNFKRRFNVKKFKFVFAEKVETFALVSFIFSLFLLDVNANIIGAYGPDIKVNLLFGKTILSTHMFWVGMLFLGFCFLLLTTRTLYHPERRRNRWDVFFAIFGTLGLMIILSGGMLLFWHNNALEIPFLGGSITRISYYHIGISLEVIVAFYFAMFK